jgi:hypothetical protein
MNMHPAYIAGLFDGEGTVGLNRQSVLNSLRPTVAIMITAPGVTEAFQQKYGGYVYMRNPVKEGWAPTYQWILHSAPSMIPFFQDIWPYIVIKKAAVAVVTYVLPTYDKADRSFRKPIPTRPWWGLSDAGRERREWAKSTLSLLNQRGPKEQTIITSEIYDFANAFLAPK